MTATTAIPDDVPGDYVSTLLNFMILIIISTYGSALLSTSAKYTSYNAQELLQ